MVGAAFTDRGEWQVTALSQVREKSDLVETNMMLKINFYFEFCTLRGLSATANYSIDKNNCYFQHKKNYLILFGTCRSFLPYISQNSATVWARVLVRQTLCSHWKDSVSLRIFVINLSKDTNKIRCWFLKKINKSRKYQAYLLSK